MRGFQTKGQSHPQWKSSDARRVRGRGLVNVAVTYTAGYATPPADAAEAVMELVGLRYRGRDRLGKTSEGIGGMATTSYAQRDVSPFIASVIARYTRTNLA